MTGEEGKKVAGGDDDDEYRKKLEEMKKYIPFLETMIQRLERSNEKAREAQLEKMKSLYGILVNNKKKLKIETLKRCEDVLKNLMKKVDKLPILQSAISKPSQSTAVSSKTPASSAPNAIQVQNSSTNAEKESSSKDKHDVREDDKKSRGATKTSDAEVSSTQKTEPTQSVDSIVNKLKLAAARNRNQQQAESSKSYAPSSNSTSSSVGRFHRNGVEGRFQENNRDNCQPKSSKDSLEQSRERLKKMILQTSSLPSSSSKGQPFRSPEYGRSRRVSPPPLWNSKGPAWDSNVSPVSSDSDSMDDDLLFKRVVAAQNSKLMPRHVLTTEVDEDSRVIPSVASDEVPSSSECGGRQPNSWTFESSEVPRIPSSENGYHQASSWKCDSSDKLRSPNSESGYRHSPSRKLEGSEKLRSPDNETSYHQPVSWRSDASDKSRSVVKNDEISKKTCTAKPTFGRSVSNSSGKSSLQDRREDKEDKNEERPSAKSLREKLAQEISTVHRVGVSTGGALRALVSKEERNSKPPQKSPVGKGGPEPEKSPVRRKGNENQDIKKGSDGHSTKDKKENSGRPVDPRRRPSIDRSPSPIRSPHGDILKPVPMDISPVKRRSPPLPPPPPPLIPPPLPVPAPSKGTVHSEKKDASGILASMTPEELQRIVTENLPYISVPVPLTKELLQNVKNSTSSMPGSPNTSTWKPLKDPLLPNPADVPQSRLQSYPGREPVHDQHPHLNMSGGPQPLMQQRVVMPGQMQEVRPATERRTLLPGQPGYPPALASDFASRQRMGHGVEERSGYPNDPRIAVPRSPMTDGQNTFHVQPNINVASKPATPYAMATRCYGVFSPAPDNFKSQTLNYPAQHGYQQQLQSEYGQYPRNQASVPVERSPQQQHWGSTPGPPVTPQPPTTRASCMSVYQTHTQKQEPDNRHSTMYSNARTSYSHIPGSASSRTLLQTPNIRPLLPGSGTIPPLMSQPTPLVHANMGSPNIHPKSIPSRNTLSERDPRRRSIEEERKPRSSDPRRSSYSSSSSDRRTDSSDRRRDSSSDYRRRSEGSDRRRDSDVRERKRDSSDSYDRRKDGESRRYDSSERGREKDHRDSSGKNSDRSEEDTKRSKSPTFSPLNSLYGVVNIPRTGRGYGVQSFRIPKIKRDPPRPPSPPPEGLNEEHSKEDEEKDAKDVVMIDEPSNLESSGTEESKSSKPEGSSVPHIPESVTKELVESLILKTLESGEYKKFFEHAHRLEQIKKKLKDKKLNKKITKILALDSDDSEESDDSDDKTKKKRAIKSKKGKTVSDSEDEQDEDDQENVIRTKKRKGARAVIESDEESDSKLTETLSESKYGQVSKEDKENTAVSETKELKEKGDKQLSEKTKAPRKKYNKRRSDLELLQENVREMFISEGVVTATGLRLCRLKFLKETHPGLTLEEISRNEAKRLEDEVEEESDTSSVVSKKKVLEDKPEEKKKGKGKKPKTERDNKEFKREKKKRGPKGHVMDDNDKESEDTASKGKGKTRVSLGDSDTDDDSRSIASEVSVKKRGRPKKISPLKSSPDREDKKEPGRRRVPRVVLEKTDLSKLHMGTAVTDAIVSSNDSEEEFLIHRISTKKRSGGPCRGVARRGRRGHSSSARGQRGRGRNKNANNSFKFIEDDENLPLRFKNVRDKSKIKPRFRRPIMEIINQLNGREILVTSLDEIFPPPSENETKIATEVSMPSKDVCEKVEDDSVVKVSEGTDSADMLEGKMEPEEAKVESQEAKVESQEAKIESQEAKIESEETSQSVVVENEQSTNAGKHVLSIITDEVETASCRTSVSSALSPSSSTSSIKDIDKSVHIKLSLVRKKTGPKRTKKKRGSWQLGVIKKKNFQKYKSSYSDSQHLKENILDEAKEGTANEDNVDTYKNTSADTVHNSEVEEVGNIVPVSDVKRDPQSNDTIVESVDDCQVDCKIVEKPTVLRLYEEKSIEGVETTDSASVLADMLDAVEKALQIADENDNNQESKDLCEDEMLKMQKRTREEMRMRTVDESELINLDYAYDCTMKNNRCLLCVFSGKTIVAHYKQCHPESEVFISRLPIDEAKRAISESEEKCYNVEGFELELMPQTGKRKKEGYFRCRFCKHTSSLPVNFYEHISSHTGEYRYQCCKCPYMSATRTTFKGHFYNHHPQNKLKQGFNFRILDEGPANNIDTLFGYLCSACNFVQLLRGNLEKHISLRHKNDPETPKIIRISMSKPLVLSEGTRRTFNSLEDTFSIDDISVDDTESRISLPSIDESSVPFIATECAEELPSGEGSVALEERSAKKVPEEAFQLVREEIQDSDVVTVDERSELLKTVNEKITNISLKQLPERKTCSLENTTVEVESDLMDVTENCDLDIEAIENAFNEAELLPEVIGTSVQDLAAVIKKDPDAIPSNKIESPPSKDSEVIEAVTEVASGNQDNPQITPMASEQESEIPLKDSENVSEGESRVVVIQSVVSLKDGTQDLENALKDDKDSTAVVQDSKESSDDVNMKIDGNQLQDTGQNDQKTVEKSVADHKFVQPESFKFKRSQKVFATVDLTDDETLVDSKRAMEAAEALTVVEKETPKDKKLKGAAKKIAELQSEVSKLLSPTKSSLEEIGDRRITRSFSKTDDDGYEEGSNDSLDSDSSSDGGGIFSCYEITDDEKDEDDEIEILNVISCVKDMKPKECSTNFSYSVIESLANHLVEPKFEPKVELAEKPKEVPPISNSTIKSVKAELKTEKFNPAATSAPNTTKTCLKIIGPNSLTCVTVGTLGVRKFKENSLLFSCLIRGCIFACTRPDLLEKHLLTTHKCTYWDGICQTCNEGKLKQDNFISLSGSEASEKQPLTTALYHLMSKHLRAIEVEVPTSIPVTPETSTVSSDSSPVPKSAVEVGSSGDGSAEQPRKYIRIRRLSGDKLSVPKMQEDSPVRSSVSPVEPQPPAVHPNEEEVSSNLMCPENLPEENDNGDDDLPFLRIESVVSLNPNAIGSANIEDPFKCQDTISNASDSPSKTLNLTVDDNLSIVPSASSPVSPNTTTTFHIRNPALQTGSQASIVIPGSGQTVSPGSKASILIPSPTHSLSPNAKASLVLPPGGQGLSVLSSNSTAVISSPKGAQVHFFPISPGQPLPSTITFLPTVNKTVVQSSKIPQQLRGLADIIRPNSKQANARAKELNLHKTYGSTNRKLFRKQPSGEQFNNIMVRDMSLQDSYLPTVLDSPLSTTTSSTLPTAVQSDKLTMIDNAGPTRLPEVGIFQDCIADTSVVLPTSLLEPTLGTISTVDTASLTAPQDSSHGSLVPAVSILKRSSTLPTQAGMKKKFGSKTFRAFEYTKAAKLLRVYQLMLNPEKLRHLYKCMARHCSFTTDLASVFEQHCQKHVELHLRLDAYKKQSAVERNKTRQRKSSAAYRQQCAYCCSIHDNPAALLAHTQKAHGHCRFQCAYCFFRAMTQSYVVLHQNTNHTNLRIRVLLCHVPENLPLPIPNLPLRGTVMLPYVCNQGSCGSTFYNPKAFLVHLETEHPHLTCYYCHICEDHSFKPDRLIMHYKLHSFCLYQCRYCLHGTDTKEEMQHHLCNFHENLLPLVVVRSCDPSGLGHDASAAEVALEQLQEMIVDEVEYMTDDGLERPPTPPALPDTEREVSLCDFWKDYQAFAEENPGIDTTDEGLFSGEIPDELLADEESGMAEDELPTATTEAAVDNAKSGSVSAPRMLESAEASSNIESKKLQKSNENAGVAKKNSNSKKRKTDSDVIVLDSPARPEKKQRVEVPDVVVIDSDDSSAASSPVKRPEKSPYLLPKRSDANFEPLITLKERKGSEFKNIRVSVVDPLGVSENDSQSSGTEMEPQSSGEMPSLPTKKASSGVITNSSIAAKIQKIKNLVLNPLCDLNFKDMEHPMSTEIRGLVQFVLKGPGSHSKRKVTVVRDKEVECPEIEVTESELEVPESEMEVDIVSLSADEQQNEDDDLVTPEELTSTGFSGEQLYRCGNATCNYAASDAATLREHLLICDMSRDCSVLICVHCQRQFKQINSLLEHLRIHGVCRYGCALCAFRAPVSQQAIKHLKQRHKIGNTRMVPIDPRKQNHDTDEFVVFPKDRMRWKSKINSDPQNKRTFGPEELESLPGKWIVQHWLGCGACSYRTKVVNNMRRHLKLHLQDDLPESDVPTYEPVNPVPCLENAEMMFDKMTNLAASSHASGRMGGTKYSGSSASSSAGSVWAELHLPKFVPEHERYVCGAPGCSYLTCDETMLKHHLRALHCDETAYRCPHCPEALQQDNNGQVISIDRLGAHLKMHDNRLYKCAHCMYNHFQRHIVERHLADKHPEKRPFVHVVREPEGESAQSEASGSVERPSSSSTILAQPQRQPWRCGLCKFRSSTRAEVVNHAWTVHGLKSQYKCGLCTFRSSSRPNFEMHFTSRHPGSDKEMIHVYQRLEEPTSPEGNAGEGTDADSASGSAPAPFDSSPRWGRDKPRIIHVRGILMEAEEDTKRHQAKRDSDLLQDDSGTKKIKKAEEPEREERELDELESRFGPYGRPVMGNFYFCTICKKYKTKVKNDMKVHLYRELSYVKWVCTYCRLTSCSKKHLSKHSSRVHDPKPEAIAPLTPDNDIEEWVDRLLATQHQIMRAERPKLSDASSVETSPIKPDSMSTMESDSDMDVDSLSSETSIRQGTKRKPLPVKSGEDALFAVPAPKKPAFAVSEDSCDKDDYDTEDDGYSDNSSLSDNVKEKATTETKGLFVCKQCSQEFSQIRGLKMHIRYAHLKMGGYSCGYCGISASSALSITLHTRSQHGDLPESIVMNKDSHLSPEYWEQAWGIKPQTRTKQRTRTSSASTDGLGDADVSGKCRYCEYRCKNSSDLRSHEMRHWVQKPFACGHCDFDAVREYEVKKHSMKAHPDKTINVVERSLPQNPEIRPVRCGRKSSSQQQSSTNVTDSSTEEKRSEPAETSVQNSDASEAGGETTTLSSTPRVFRCFYCSMSGKSLMLIHRHWEESHKVRNPNEVNQPFRYKELDLENFRKGVVGKNAYICMYCKIRGSMEMLEEHHRVEHPGLDFKVDHIKVPGLSRSESKAVLQNTDQFKSTKSSIVSMKDDGLSSSESAAGSSLELKFKCGYCNEDAMDEEKASVHHKVYHSHLPSNIIKVVDTPEKTPYKLAKGTAYECPKCQYTALKYGTVYEHIARHAKPYKCTLCNQGFAFPSKTRAHIMDSHPEVHPDDPDNIITDKAAQEEIKALKLQIRLVDTRGQTSPEQSLNTSPVVPQSPVVKKAIARKSTTLSSQAAVMGNRRYHAVARKSTNPLSYGVNIRVTPKQSEPEDSDSEMPSTSEIREEFSYYGTRPDPVDLSRLTTLLSYSGQMVTVNCATLTQIWDLNPTVRVFDMKYSMLTMRRS
ncbi:uncharacterized protein [Anabrus simplex]|uniref:uncharacterized protein n=1 Tax=Anabrus simplex TaxID=316456 RepID=UPI0035A3567B